MKTLYSASCEVVALKSCIEIEGYLLDMQTANLVRTIYDSLSPKNRKKLESLPLMRQVDICWKLYDKCRIPD